MKHLSPSQFQKTIDTSPEIATKYLYDEFRDLAGRNKRFDKGQSDCWSIKFKEEDTQSPFYDEESVNTLIVKFKAERLRSLRYDSDGEVVGQNPSVKLFYVLVESQIDNIELPLAIAEDQTGLTGDQAVAEIGYVSLSHQAIIGYRDNYPLIMTCFRTCYYGLDVKEDSWVDYTDLCTCKEPHPKTMWWNDYGLGMLEGEDENDEEDEKSSTTTLAPRPAEIIKPSSTNDIANLDQDKIILDELEESFNKQRYGDELMLAYRAIKATKKSFADLHL